ncbi:hypothetical protein Ae201684_005210 [Aphanomyces euteiches]|uniref:Uncharacterized protein n=1 Tax=Aphanomyces euteiches TaxID=100861 RepID=A0A6G0XFM2_9STRA|nr:hypothetical protein Ae201684_005210 [Aphanomyces euteiches]
MFVGSATRRRCGSSFVAWENSTHTVIFDFELPTKNTLFAEVLLPRAEKPSTDTVAHRHDKRVQEIEELPQNGVERRCRGPHESRGELEN